MRFLRVGIPIVAFSTLAAAIIGQSLPPEPYTFLSKHLGFSSAELATLETGQTLVKLPKTTETREVAAFAIARLDVPTDFFIEKVRDIVNFKKGENVLQIGKFGNPPRLADLAGLTVDQVDIDAIKRCRVNSCDLKMSAEFIERFRKVDWASPTYRELVTQLVHQMLLEQLQDYLKGGIAALVKYDDKSYALALSDEVRSLLKPASYMFGYAPEFQKYMEEFPLTRPGNATAFENFAYWSKEDFGLKPVITMTHVTIYRRGRGASDVVIGSKGIYASHYFEGSLGLTALARNDSSHPSRSYLIYVNRSRTDALRGMFAGMKRSLIGGRLRDGAKKTMEVIKQRLETEYDREDVSLRR